MDLAAPLNNAIVALGAVASIQLALALLYWSKVGRRRRAIRRLEGLGFAEIPAKTPGFPWLGWVRDRFAGPSAFGATREDAARELDRRQVAGPEFLLLSRIGVMAPLLGLLLTAYSIWEFQRDRMAALAAARAGDILAEALPLFAGVAVGAALAILNQLLMIHAAMRTTGLRLGAMDWFDGAADRARAALPPEPMVKAASRVEAVANRLGSATVKLDRAVDGLASAVGSVAGSASRLDLAVGSLAEGQARHADALAATASCLARLEEATGRIMVPYGELAEAAGGMVGRLASIAESWRASTADSTLAGQRAAILGFRAAEAMARSADEVEAASKGWSEAVAAQHAGLATLREAASAYVANQAGFAASMGRFEQGSLLLLAKTESVGRAFEQTTGHLDTFRGAVGEFRSVVGEMAPAVRALRTVPEGIAALADSARQVGESTRVLEEIIRGYYRDAAGIAPAVESLRGQLEGADAVGRRFRELLDRVDAGLDSTLKGLDGTSSGFRAGLDGASRGLGASIGRLDAVLGESVGPLARDLAAAAAPLARLHETLAGLDVLTKDLKGLPDSTRELAQAAAGAAKTLRGVERLTGRLDDFGRAIGSAADGAAHDRGRWRRFFGGGNGA